MLTLWCIFDILAKEQEIIKLETAAGQPDFWNDQRKAQDDMRRLSELKDDVNTWRNLEKRVTDLLELLELAYDANDPSVIHEIHVDTEELRSGLQELEFKLALGGRYDRKGAILAIHAGAGGTESQDWANMLLRMYLRWAERTKRKTEILDISPGEEAGIKTAIVEIQGEYGYGYLKGEHGVHRLVRLSPFDSDHARHTSFALVEVLPEAEGDTDIIITPDDIKVETFRSSGPGGQNMQKTSSAVRITHLSTGIISSCQSERSQYQNKEYALKILKARIMEVELAKKVDERAKIKGERIDAAWGNQIRSYVLHPYRMVKDHRTDFQTENPVEVLDGGLDEFIKAYLKLKIGK